MTRPPPATPGDDLTRLADSILRVRRARPAHLPMGLFGGEQAWDILLALFVADAEGRRLTGRQAVGEARGPTASGRRWVQYLTQEALIVGDGEGNLDDTLTLTPQGLHAMEGWLDDARAALTA